MSSHAVITNDKNKVLLLKANYGSFNWGLPGGALDKEETIHDALLRECREELACDIEVQYLSGVYYHKAYNSQAFIFRCVLAAGACIQLSDEHSEYGYFALDELSDVQQRRAADCLDYSGLVVSGRF